jgi:uncharacterized membrane protein
LLGEKPPAWKWFVAYCVFMAVMYFLTAVVGVVFLFTEPAELDMRAGEATLMGVFFIGLGLLFFAPFAYAPFVPRKRWAWILSISLICLGLTSLCCLPASIPLLIAWLKPETKAYFGIFPSAPPPPPMPGTY